MVVNISYVLLIIIAALYLPFLGNAFVSDDIAWLLNHPVPWKLIQSTGWPQAIHLGGVLQYLTNVLVGPSPWLYRLQNIAFHCLCAVLVCFIVSKLLNRKVGIVTGLIFAVHPIAVESVTWISGGVYALAAVLFLASFWFYINKKYSLSVLIFSFSLLVSEKSLGLFLIFIAYEWFWGNLSKNWKRLTPYLLLSITMIVFYITKVNLRTESISGSLPGGMQFFNPLFQIPAAVSTYINLLLWPKNLTLYHGYFVFSSLSNTLRTAITFLLLILTLYSFLKKKVWGFWFIWFYAALAPTLTPLKISWIVAERYAYLASIGIFVLLATAFNKIYSKYKEAGMVAGTLILLALSLRTVFRNLEWRSQDTLWPATLRESPQVAYSWNNMGDVYSRKGDELKASQMFKQATIVDPEYADAYFNLGLSYLKLGLVKEAEENFKKATSLNPDLLQYYNKLKQIKE